MQCTCWQRYHGVPIVIVLLHMHHWQQYKPIKLQQQQTHATLYTHDRSIDCEELLHNCVEIL